MSTTPNGYFVVSMRSRRCALPWLSVPHERLITADDSPFTADIATSTMSPTKEPSNSRLAMVLNGSPLAKAHGAVALVSSSENHGASLVFRPPCESQPPMATFSPSALASILKTSPS